LGVTRPHVIYLDVLKNKRLGRLAEKVKKITDKYQICYQQPWPYKPHITIAFSDLTKDGFQEAKRYLKDKKFFAKTKIDHVAISKEDKEGKFKECKRFSFVNS